MKKRRVGILGGTFNPIHSGHLSLAWYAKNELKLNEVWIMPTKYPPHKNLSSIVSDDIRCDMIELSIKNCKGFILNKLELYRNHTTYTADTLSIILNEYPDLDVYFILGADSLFDIEKWYHPEIVMKLCTLTVAIRNQYDNTKLQAHIEYLTHKYGARIILLTMPMLDISSSDIRNSLQNTGDFNRFLVTESVYDYIITNNIYSNYTNMEESVKL